MRKIKSIMVLLVVALCVSIIVPNIVPSANGITMVNAATKIALNSKKLTMIKKDKFTLAITGTKSKITWTSSNKSVATVSSKGKVTAKGNGTAVIVAKVKGKKYKCNVTVTTKAQINKQLTTIYNWLCTDIWNEGFCNIYHYLEDGKGYMGQDLNINSVINKLNKKLKKKETYDIYITSLTNKKYNKYKKYWNTAYSEMNILQEIVKTNNLTPSSNIDFPYQTLSSTVWQILSVVNKL